MQPFTAKAALGYLIIASGKLSLLVEVVGWENFLSFLAAFGLALGLIVFLVYKTKAIFSTVFTYLYNTAFVLSTVWIVHQGYIALRSNLDFTDIDETFQFATAHFLDYVHNITQQITELEKKALVNGPSIPQ